MWQIIKQSLNMAKKKANAAGTLIFNMTSDREIEDLNFEIHWIKIIIQGTEEQEKEEYEEALQMYQPLNKIFKKEIPKDDRMMRRFKSKILSSLKVDECYEKGYGAINDNNLANKLLEMGIITHIEWLKDFDSRDVVLPLQP